MYSPDGLVAKVFRKMDFRENSTYISAYRRNKFAAVFYTAKFICRDGVAFFIHAFLRSFYACASGASFWVLYSFRYFFLREPINVFSEYAILGKI